MARFDDDVGGPAGPTDGAGSPGAAGPSPAVPPSERDLAGFASATRIDAAVGARRRERWLRQQACEDVSLLATCWSLAEAGRTVVLTTRAGTSRRGRLRVVGEDFVALEEEHGRQHLVPLAGLATLRAVTAGRSKPDGPAGRPVRTGARLAEALASLAGERPLVAVACDGPADPVRGELLGAGADVAVVAPSGGDAETRSTVYVRLPSVAELSVMASG